MTDFEQGLIKIGGQLRKHGRIVFVSPDYSDTKVWWEPAKQKFYSKGLANPESVIAEIAAKAEAVTSEAK